MSSSRTLIPFLVALLLAPLVGCGKKGAPLPPLRVVPQKTSDLAVRQEGGLLVLGFTYPATTTAGLALDGIDAVELVGLVRPRDSTPPDAREVESSGETLLTLRGAELESSITGSRIDIRLPLETPVPDEVGQQIFAVKTSKGEETSPLSNRTQIVPRNPPEPPAGLEVEARPDGVLLRWEPAEGSEAEGFEVFRRGANERSYGEPLGRLDAERRRFLDKSARYENRYFYTVRALVEKDPPILTGPAGEKEIDYRDRFAPPLPTNFVALAEGSRIRLRWDEPDAEDVRGVLVYRREPGRDFRPITEEPVAGTEYIDSGLAMGLTYAYRIRVVDRVGNESELSDPITVDLR